ncbi:hypothetical protein [Streptomyces litmocidini]|uniref:Uncharacterized protein n=1 Tax=Streptomyces litmocidini TaxID=67318 RepID=A0ABW7UFA7_9ACTN
MRHRRIDKLMTREVVAGKLPFRGMVPAVERMCATADGVVSVSSARLAYDTDDTEQGDGRS